MNLPRVLLLAGSCLIGLLSLAANLAGQVVGSAAAAATAGGATTPVTTPASPVTPIEGPTPAILLVIDPAWANTALDLSHPRGAFPARLVNVSARARVGSDASTLIGGGSIQGNGNLPVLARAIGPGLRSYGVVNALASAPQLSVFSGPQPAAETNVVTDPAAKAAAYVGAFPALPPQANAAVGDAAIVGRPGAGAVTAHCTSQPGASGVALVEFYDADSAASATSARFVNFSARGLTGAGEDTMVIGFAVAGDGEATVLLRGVGPTLGALGVTSVLSDPAIELYAGNTVIASNDNWQSGGATATAALQDAARATGAFALASDREAALLVTLKPGTYTLHVHGTPTPPVPTPANAITGVVLGEVYQVPASSAFDAGAATNAFGLDVFRQLIGTGSAGNLVLSPYSMAAAFSLAYAGAEGDTRAEMARVLHLPADNTAVVSGFGRVRDALTATANDSVTIARRRSTGSLQVDPIQWQIANRMFGQTGYPFRDTYVQLLNEGFGAPLQSIDFNANPEAARQLINGWVQTVTHDRIINLIPQGGITTLTRLSLVNALYLKAPWDVPFEAFRTAPDEFHVSATKTTPISMMHRTDYLRYANENGLSVVALDYLGTGLQFVILLPKESESVDALAARLTPADLSRWAALTSADARYVGLSLPKFKVAGGSVALAPALMALGMTTAFDQPPGSANFDGMAPRKPGDYLALQSVFHQTFIALDENGTEAAAATAVNAGATSIPVNPTPIEVYVDRPFLFLIQHRPTGTCLFVGRISDPT